MKKTNLRFVGYGFLISGAMAGLLTGCTTYVEAPRPAPVVVTSPPVVEAPPPVVIVQPQPVTEVVVVHEEHDFFEPLNPYGRWVDVAGYGRCWTPSVADPNWRPYSAGHWERTDAGWYWVSDEPWGWATYHYGRWLLDGRIGWVWVPQTQWAPAWVTFHQGGGYIGWAPLPPDARFRGDGSLQVEVRDRKPREFVFVEERKFMQPVHPTTVVVNNTTIINQTVNITNVKIVNNTVINEGPRREAIEKASGMAVAAVAVNELRRKQEAPVIARRGVSVAVQPVTRPDNQSPENRLREDAARRAEMAKQQMEAEKKSQEEARLKAAQAEEKARIAQTEAKAKAEAQARADAQRKAHEAEVKSAQEKAAQEAAARRATEVNAPLDAQKKAQDEARLKAIQAQEQAKAAQLEAQRKAREAEMKAAQEAAARRANDVKAQQEAQKKAQEEARLKAAQAEALKKPVPVNVPDPQVHARAKAAIAAVPELKGVTVATTNGVVHLSGTVASAEHKRTAEVVALKIEGVRDVHNNVTVKQ